MAATESTTTKSIAPLLINASAISNKGNKIIEKHRMLQIKLDKEMGINPFNDWETEISNIL